MVSVDELRFDEFGLIPAVVVDADTGALLMLAYMSRESLKKSMDEGLSCFWSRSRGRLWTKGETSKNFQHIVSITADCDRDALKVAVRPDGPACHKGTYSCFEYPLFVNDSAESFSVRGLYDLLKERKAGMPEGSYTSYLFKEGRDKILKKVGEESAEVIIAAKGGDRRETVYEIADLYYHVLVLMTEMGISADEVLKELSSRHIIDHKIKQEKPDL